jgi:adenylate kinase family enzyme
MDKSILEKQACLTGNIKITSEKVHIGGNGVILLTGPSGCGKGEIAKALCKFLSIPEEKHLSMGNILRKTLTNAKENIEFRTALATKYNISNSISIFNTQENRSEVINKAESYKNDIIALLEIKNNFISQLDWLEFCITNGLLVPDEWTEKIIEALFDNTPELHNGIFILDGYPRTVVAGEYLLDIFNRLNIPIIKVLHLFITKEQMKIRATHRKRIDDTGESLERRYQFYIEKVQPCIDYLKYRLGTTTVALVDAHQPVYNTDKQFDKEASIHEVIISVMQALGLPRYILDLK